MHLNYKMPVWNMSKKTRKGIRQYPEMHRLIHSIKARKETVLNIFVLNVSGAQQENVEK